MPAPDGPRRGHLGLLDPTALTLESLVAVDVAMRVHVLTIVSAAHREACTPPPPLPTGHDLPVCWESFDFAWTGDHAVDVPSDGTWHSTPVFDRPVQTSMRHVCVPREGTEVLRFLAFQNPAPAPLLSGPLDVTVGGDFLLTSHLGTVAPGGEARVGLGVEQAIKVARNTRYAEQTTGLLRQLELHHEISIEVRNLLPAPALLEVRERVPVTREDEKDVTVEVGPVRPPWEPFEQVERPARGTWRWVVTVPAGGTTTLQAAYQVKLPARLELQGGNRREV